MHHENGKSAHELQAKIAIGNAVDGVETDVVKAKSLCLKTTVGVVGGSCKRTASNGGTVHTGAAVCKTLQIAQQHHGIRHQMVSKGDGLCSLKMGIAWQNGTLVRLCLARNGSDELTHRIHNGIAFLAQIHTQIQRHLIVAATRRMKLFAHIADTRRQLLLHEHMDILTGKIERQLATFQVLKDARKTVDKLFRLGLGNDALRAQHRGVRHASRDILLIHLTVEPNGRIEIVRQLVSSTVGSSRPHFCHNLLLKKLSEKTKSGLPLCVSSSQNGNHCLFVYLISLRSWRQP